MGGVGQRIEEAIELIEMEVRHAAAYVNAAVIPQVRAESISALRNVANSLRNFADRLDQQQTQQQARQQAQQQAQQKAEPVPSPAPNHTPDQTKEPRP
jgi:Sec-independent protein translocase protein TatA